ncbi:CARDB domain-containing protein [Pseudomonas sp. CR3202]|uniref:CARDB domain-containing protein n=1 Tax=Pseudomonas sp. CR3202 TaxID=3351532 RepID=UPI003BF42ACA
MRLVRAVLILCLSAVALNVYAFEYSRKNFGYLYALLPSELSQMDRENLENLRALGINTIPVSGYSINELAVNLERHKGDSTLSRFKAVLGVSGFVYDQWYLKKPDVCSPGAEYLPEAVKDFLRRVTELALRNKDVIVGYYAFDEPSLAWKGGGRGICKKYQELVRSYIRSLDPDVLKRPVMLANTMWSLSDADITYSMSPDAQDVILIDQYDGDEGVLTYQFEKWRNHGLLTKPIVPVYPAFNVSSCEDPFLRGRFQKSLDNALSAVFEGNLPWVYGAAYFAYWPINKPDFSYGIDNCKKIYDSVSDHYSALPDLVATKITNSPVEFYPGQDVLFSVEVKNIGKTRIPKRWIGVLLLFDGKCGDRCLWGGVISDFAPGESKIIKINGNGRWKAAQGKYEVSALVDDARTIQEKERFNNGSLSRTISIGNGPDLKPVALNWTPSPITKGVPLSLSVTLENIGNVATGYNWHGVLYTVNGACTKPACQWGGVHTSVAPGGRITIGTSQNHWVTESGRYEVSAFVDDQNVFAESDEGNNRISKILTVP